MLRLRFLALAACAALAGCVSGYGGCLFLRPASHTLTGRVHFRSYPVTGGVDHVTLLDFDRTEYVYAPAKSLMCIPVNEVQLTGLAEFPEEVIENQRVSVHGRLTQVASGREHTDFALQVITLLPLRGRPADAAPSHP